MYQCINTQATMAHLPDRKAVKSQLTTISCPRVQSSFLAGNKIELLCPIFFAPPPNALILPVDSSKVVMKVKAEGHQPKTFLTPIAWPGGRLGTTPELCTVVAPGKAVLISGAPRPSVGPGSQKPLPGFSSVPEARIQGCSVGEISLSRSSKGVYDNFRRWQQYKQLARKHFPCSTDTPAFSCFLIPVLRSLARHRPEMSLEEGIPRAMREWNRTSNYDRMVFYEMAEKFMEFEEEEESVLIHRAQQLTLAEVNAESTKSHKAQAKTASLSKKSTVRAPQPRKRKGNKVQPFAECREIPPEAVTEYMEIMEGLQKAREGSEEEKEERGRSMETPDPHLLQYIESLCDQPEFISKVEAIIHPAFLEAILSPEISYDPLSLSQELELEDKLSLAELVEKRLHKKAQQEGTESEGNTDLKAPVSRAVQYGPIAPRHLRNGNRERPFHVKCSVDMNSTCSNNTLSKEAPGEVRHPGKAGSKGGSFVEKEAQPGMIGSIKGICSEKKLALTQEGGVNRHMTITTEPGQQLNKPWNGMESLQARTTTSVTLYHGGQQCNDVGLGGSVVESVLEILDAKQGDRSKGVDSTKSAKFGPSYPAKRMGGASALGQVKLERSEAIQLTWESARKVGTSSTAERTQSAPFSSASFSQCGTQSVSRAASTFRVHNMPDSSQNDLTIKTPGRSGHQVFLPTHYKSVRSPDSKIDLTCVDVTPGCFDKSGGYQQLVIRNVPQQMSFTTNSTSILPLQSPIPDHAKLDLKQHRNSCNDPQNQERRCPSSISHKGAGICSLAEVQPMNRLKENSYFHTYGFADSRASEPAISSVMAKNHHGSFYAGSPSVLSYPKGEFGSMAETVSQFRNTLQADKPCHGQTYFNPQQGRETAESRAKTLGGKNVGVQAKPCGSVTPNVRGIHENIVRGPLHLPNAALQAPAQINKGPEQSPHGVEAINGIVCPSERTVTERDSRERGQIPQPQIELQRSISIPGEGLFLSSNFEEGLSLKSLQSVFPKTSISTQAEEGYSKQSSTVESSEKMTGKEHVHLDKEEKVPESPCETNAAFPSQSNTQCTIQGICKTNMVSFPASTMQQGRRKQEDRFLSSTENKRTDKPPVHIRRDVEVPLLQQKDSAQLLPPLVIRTQAWEHRSNQGDQHSTASDEQQFQDSDYLRPLVPDQSRKKQTLEDTFLSLGVKSMEQNQERGNSTCLDQHASLRGLLSPNVKNTSPVDEAQVKGCKKDQSLPEGSVSKQREDAFITSHVIQSPQHKIMLGQSPGQEQLRWNTETTGGVNSTSLLKSLDTEDLTQISCMLEKKLNLSLDSTSPPASPSIMSCVCPVTSPAKCFQQESGGNLLNVSSLVMHQKTQQLTNLVPSLIRRDDSLGSKLPLQSTKIETSEDIIFKEKGSPEGDSTCSESQLLLTTSQLMYLDSVMSTPEDPGNSSLNLDPEKQDFWKKQSPLDVGSNIWQRSQTMAPSTKGVKRSSSANKEKTEQGVLTPPGSFESKEPSEISKGPEKQTKHRKRRQGPSMLRRSKRFKTC
ncbi:uncharacterized protein LOC142481334 isoform X1 [Ascaphus truei]|uniref:uncharacterized protein LOC142481334 isoform X1 n=2 Tax=Ascaphus truei TaxID=8439 RepID=UPI003F59A36E